ncbi:MAG: YgiQ family radical SAM protein [Planctomycetes bacterium]|nr:YgiQ family radical SAM protein [Planctomycetota bacterium]
MAPASPTPCSTPPASAFLPTTAAEIKARGWDEVDVVFVSGDAYVDHPSFAAALLGRLLEAEGFRVAILPQPRWNDASEFRQFGRPRLCFAVSAGNMDSMINHYTANKKRRNDDAYSPGGRIELRPDRATNVYAQRCREAFSGVPVIAGGVEASLRRIAHFDYWSETVRPSILVTSKADLLGFGMGERVIVEVCRRLRDGKKIADCRDLRGVAYLLGSKESLPAHEWHDAACDNVTVELPSCEQITADKVAFAHATRLLHHETNPKNGRRLVQKHGDRLLVVNPPALALDEREMDRVYDLPYTRKPHPRYTEPIPAHTMIKDSVTTMRGCFGGCTFCSITMHQGRAIQSRSQRSILGEVQRMAADPDFAGAISDVGGPTANMYQMRCTRPDVEAKCRRLSCIHPTVCKLLGTDHGPTKQLLKKVRETPGVKSVRVASGIRMDLARFDDEYLEDMARHHVGGQLKVAPEHTSEKVLSLMKKPATTTFDEFARKFAAASARAGKEQYLIPYFIASHPGSGVNEMIELAVFLKARGYRPRQVQDFIPAPMDIATCMYHTGLDPMTMQPVETVKKLKDREVQRALMQYFKPENWFVVRKALLDAGRKDLIGSGPQCLIPINPPKVALQARRDGANGRGGRRGDPTYVHAKDAGVKSKGGLPCAPSDDEDDERDD